MMSPPFFIVGAERSGTTLLMLMLNAHSQLAIPYESFFITEIYPTLPDPENLGDLAQRQALLDRILSHRWVEHWNEEIRQEDIVLEECETYEKMVTAVFGCFARLKGKARWGDKTPAYTYRMDILNRLFPDCLFVHIIRDGRDVAGSLRRLWYAGQLVRGLEYWKDIVNLARQMGRMLPDSRYTEVRYEDLVHDPVQELRRLSSFLGLSYEAGMMDYDETSAQVVGNLAMRHHQNVLKKPDPKLCYQWKRGFSRGEKALADFFIGDRLQEFGYDLANDTPPFFSLYRYAYVCREGLLWRYKNLTNSRREKGSH